jgi:hypothetical protein
MYRLHLNLSLLLLLALSLISCDKTPRGVLSMDDMADLIVDLQLADAYIESHIQDFDTDSSKLVIKQSVFKKHGITQKDYDSSMVWYTHNMDDYIKANDKALATLKKRYDKLDKGDKNRQPGEMMGMDDGPGEPTHNPIPGPAPGPRGKRLPKLGTDIQKDTTDLWQGTRSYMLAQGEGRGFITFDLPPDANKHLGDRYQLGYKLHRGGNEFKVCLSIDYTDGGTTQITRGTNSDGWVYIDLQSDTARHVRRVYGYVSYDIKRGHVAYVDSLLLMRTRLNLGNYGIIHAQRKLERKK